MNDRDIYSLDDFMACVQCGAFIDDDGTGEILDGNLEGLGEIAPSTTLLSNFVWPMGAKYVEWFNK